MNNEIEISASEARALVDRIKTGVEVIGDLIVQAYTSRAWLMLGYASWDEMCTREFGTSRLRIPREERSETVASLRESGLSIRAIAAATGDSYETTRRALEHTGDSNESPDPQPVTGVDGKTYMPKPRPVVDRPSDDRFISADDLDELNTSPPELDEPELPFDEPEPESKEPRPRRKSIVDNARDSGWELRKAIERLERIAEDDRFESNKNKMTPHLRGHLTNAIDVCQDLLDRINITQEDIR